MFIAYSLVAILILFGSGKALMSLLNRESSWHWLDQLALCFSGGVLLHYLIFLSVESFQTTLALMAGVSAIGWFLFFKDSKPTPNRISAGVSCFALFMFLLAWFGFTQEPIGGWDARAIWFFQVKILWLNGGLGESAHLNHPSIFWAHPDYPKLITALCGQMAFVTGYWNEFFPKIGLFLGFIPIYFGLLRLQEHRMSFYFLCISLLALHKVMFSGSMDGFLYAYAALIAVSLMRFLNRLKSVELLLAFLYSVIACGIKNEGAVLLISVWASFGVLSVFKFKEGARLVFLFLKRTPFAIVLLIGPIILWNLRKTQYGIASEYKFASLETLHRVTLRIEDTASLKKVFLSVFYYSQSRGAILLLIVTLLLATYVIKLRIAYRTLFLPVAAAVIYSSFLCMAYLATPYELEWHLRTSLDRTTLVFNALFFVAIYEIFTQIDERIIRKGK